MKKEPTPQLLVILEKCRDKMRVQCANIGEPLVEIPIDKISTFKDQNGQMRAVITMISLLCLVDDVLRANEMTP